MYDVQVVVRRVASGDEDFLERLTAGLERIGALDPAVVYYPEDEELGIVFQIEEELLGGLLQPEGARAAA